MSAVAPQGTRPAGAISPESLVLTVSLQPGRKLLIVCAPGDRITAHEDDLRDIELLRDPDCIADVRKEIFALSRIHHRYRTLRPVGSREERVCGEPERLCKTPSTGEISLGPVRVFGYQFYRL